MTRMHRKRRLYVLPVSVTSLGCRWSLILVLSHLTWIMAQESPPEFLTPPDAGMVQLVGTAKTLTCSAVGTPSPVYSWIQNDVYYKNYSRNDTNMRTLRISSLQEDDSGMFRCLATNALGSELSLAAEIKVAVLPNFTSTGVKEVTVDQGKAVILPIPPIKRLALDVSWLENNVSMFNDDVYFSLTRNLSLVLLSVDKNMDRKEYRVKADYFFTSFSAVSSPYILRVREGNGTDSNNPTNIPPEMIVPLEDTNAVKGPSETVELICIINARPMDGLTIKWYRVYNNGTKMIIDSNDKYIVTSHRRKLIIKTLDESDTGRYQCEGVMNSPGYEPAISSANLFVQVPPMIATGAVPPLMERDFSQTAILPCTAQGVPQPTLSWYFNGWNISTVLKTNRYTLYPNGTLEIKNLDLPDGGKYQCFARNPAGEAYRAVWLKVNSAPPQITKAPENLTKVESADAKFYCQVTGAPSPNIVWTKVTGTSEQAVVLGGRYQQLSDSLSIVTIVKADSGVYKCNATNVKGSQSAQVYLIVITKTQIVRPPQNQTVIISMQVTFECGIIRDENTVPVWEWLFYKSPDFVEKQLTSSGRYHINEVGSLIISGVSAQDIGRYKCHVISAGGNDSRTAFLNVIELPRAPVITSVDLNPVLNNSVVVRWTPAFNGNSALRKYIITYRQENPNGNNDGVPWDVYPDNINPGLTSYIVNNLLPSRYYRFRISAVNEVGEGNASMPMPNPAIKMPVQPPSEPPRNLFCKQGGDQEIGATWEPPVETSWNGELRGYVLYYKVQNLPSVPLTELRVEGPNQRTYTIGSLVPFKEYAVRIAAYNEEGVGIMSNPFLVWTREGLPTAPPLNVVAQMINSTSVKLQWDPPYAGEIYGNNLGYTIELRQNDVLVRSIFVQSDQENLEGRQEAYVGSLNKYTWYNFTIACRTSPGLGPFSAAVTQQTDEDVPGTVGDLKFDQIQDRSCRVKWSPPNEVNGILQAYVLQYEKKSRNDTRQVVDLPASMTSYTVANLSPVTNYTIYVAAKTGKGIGAWVSADIQSGVPPELPGSPSNLAFSNIGERTVLLQFFPGYDGKTSITKWIVLAQEGGSGTYNETYSISNPTANEIWVQNLKPYTVYRLQVIAENIVGRSDPSQPSQRFETLQAAPGAPPGNVTVRAINSTAFRISWTPISSQDWNGVPRGYKIDYRKWSTEEEDAGVALVHDTAWTTVELANGLNMDSYILGQLQEWMDYQFRMISYNDVGVSPYSPNTTARTREATPSASPSDLRARSVSTTQILVSWTNVPRLEQNGQILGYKVFYKAQDSDSDPLIQDVVGEDTHNVTLSGLRKFVWYDIQVLAYTRMGDGVLSSTPVSERTDEDVPGPPVIIYFPNVTYSSAVVVWNAPKEPNGIITGYKVSYRKDGADVDEHEVEVDPNSRQYGVDGLEREVYYNFSVTARTQKGWGTKASVLVLTMLNRDRPDQPSKPTVGSLQVQARTITIAWNPGRDNYGPIRNYTIQYKMRDGVWTVFPDGIPPSQLSYTVTGLRPNTWYQFCVAATNDIGMSDYSEPSAEIQTSQDKPDGAPQNLIVVALNRTAIRASWEQPPQDTWNGQLLKYVVQYKQVQQQDYQESVVPFGTNSLVIPNLVISQTYEVQVLVTNFMGRGPPSRPATIYVGEAAPTAAPGNVLAINRSSSSIEVTWTEPPPVTQNGGLSGYKVLYFKNASNNPVEQQRISAETRYLLDQLETFTVYMVSVQAYNLAGEGPRSPLISARTSEGLPGPPGPLKFTNITMHQLTVSFLAPATPNGYVLLYEMEYFPVPKDPFEPLPPKRILRANETLVVVTGLKENILYVFTIAANTSVGRGGSSSANVTTGPQPGSPSPSSKPAVTEHDSSSLLIQWVDGDKGRSPIYGYYIQNKKEDESEFVTLQQEITGESKVYVSLTNLNPDTGYQFRIIAINNQGISLPSIPSDVFVTPGLASPQVAKPFHTEWWFLVIVALTGIIIILVIVSLLCLVTRRRKDNKEMKRSQTATTVMSEPSEPEEGGFPTYELRRSTRSTTQRNGSVKNIYGRTPPRPSPASVAYSDDDDAMSTAKPPLPDDSDSSVTDKPSDLDDSTEPSDEESDAESDKVPASPPPPAFSTVYANNDHVRQSWRFPNSNNAYVYTDSEADSSHYAVSLHNGQLVMNNTARARTPLTGFSSFV